MNSILIAIALVLAVLLLWRGLRKRSERKEEESQSDSVDTVTGWMPQATRILTAAERQAFETLSAALPGHIILAQVPVARFIKVPTRNSYAEWLRRVGHLCADLVVCDRASLVIAVVEVRTAGQVQNDRVLRRQQRLERVMKAAAVRVHVWTENALPTAAEAREAILPSPPAVATPPATPGRVSLNTILRDGDEAAEAAAEEAADLNQAPPSTWFDDLETRPAPLSPAPAPAVKKPGSESKERTPR